eukprot:7376223-Prymnesium_polylepis.1
MRARVLLARHDPETGQSPRKTLPPQARVRVSGGCARGRVRHEQQVLARRTRPRHHCISTSLKCEVSTLASLAPTRSTPAPLTIAGGRRPDDHSSAST